MEMSLKRSACRTILNDENGVERLDQIGQKFFAMRPLLVGLLSKENLPAFYHSFAQGYVLEKRHATEAVCEELDYLDDQGTTTLGQVSGVTFMGTSPRVVAAGKTGALKCWNTSSGELLYEQAFDQAYHGITSSKDGSLIAAFNEMSCVLRSAETFEKIASFDHDEKLACVAFSPDGGSIAIASLTGNVIIWNLQKKKVVARLSSKDSLCITALEISQNRVLLLAKNVLTIWDYKKDTLTRVVIGIHHKRCTYSCLSSNKVILCLSDTIKVYSINDGSEKCIKLDPHTTYKGKSYKTVVRPIHCCTFSSDEQLLIIGEVERVSLWRQVKDAPLTYQFIGGFPEASEVTYLALRGDDLAFVAAEKHAGLQLFTITPSLENMPLTQVQKTIRKRQKTAKGLHRGLHEGCLD